MKASSFYNGCGLVLVLLTAVVWPRLVLLGDYPHMDEGLSVFLGFLSHKAVLGEGPLPLMHGLPFEPLLLSWVYFLPGFAVLWLRLCDLIFACAAGLLLCRIYQLESRSALAGLLLGLLVLCPMNYPAVIDAGYKNALPPAFFFLFAAYLLARGRPAGRAWFYAGLCVAFAVLLREPFFVFALLGAAAAFALGRWAALARYVAGGLCGLLAVAALLLIWQGPEVFGGIWSAYADRGLLYAQETGRIIHNFHSGLYKSLLNFGGPIFALACIFALGLFCRLKHGGPALAHGRGCFWLAAFLLPLLEPLTKIGFLYHFAVCLPAMGALAAWLAGALPAPRCRGLCLAACALGALVSVAGLPGPARAAMTARMLENFPAEGWPDEFAAQSNPLLAAKKIRALLPPGGTLATSAFSFFLYPAAGAMPPQNGLAMAGYGLSDLSRFFVRLGRDPERLAAELRKNPPDVLAIGKAHDVHERDYAARLREGVEKSGLYDLAATVVPNPRARYGWMEYWLYKKRDRAES